MQSSSSENKLVFSFPEQQAIQLIAGTDEVGRGPLAGDVVAAAVILYPDAPIPGLKDSKKLSERQREKIFIIIQEYALSYAIGRASPEEIDKLNILQASLLAMKRAIKGLKPSPEFIYVDGNKLPQWHYDSTPVIKGDSIIQSIAAASVLAKVTRDREMKALDQKYPGYGLAQHKGYPTKFHLEALQRLGPCPLHRKSFKPVTALL